MQLLPFKAIITIWIPNMKSLFVGSTLDVDLAWDPYLGCTLWPEFSLYWYYVNPMLSLKFNILSHNSVPSGQIWKIPSQTGVIFSRWSFWVQQPCVVFKIKCFVPYFCLSQYYLLCLCKPYILLFKCNYDSLEW